MLCRKCSHTWTLDTQTDEIRDSKVPLDVYHRVYLYTFDTDTCQDIYSNTKCRSNTQEGQISCAEASAETTLT